ncbi:MAG: RNA polymerase sigma factor [Planctomycetota bacterium]|jgi:DNA-directed RNA polymerase specialized sigma24 family protein
MKINHGEDDRLVVCSARNGARTICHQRQIVEDAVTEAADRFVDALLSGRRIANLQSWAFAVGANSAKSLLRARMRPLGDLAAPCSAAVPSVRPPEESFGLDVLGALIVQHADQLVGRQLDVLLCLCRRGGTLYGVARDLGMDPATVRRSFRAALGRLERFFALGVPRPDSSEYRLLAHSAGRRDHQG